MSEMTPTMALENARQEIVRLKAELKQILSGGSEAEREVGRLEKERDEWKLAAGVEASALNDMTAKRNGMEAKAREAARLLERLEKHDCEISDGPCPKPEAKAWLAANRPLLEGEK